MLGPLIHVHDVPLCLFSIFSKSQDIDLLHHLSYYSMYFISLCCYKYIFNFTFNSSLLVYRNIIDFCVISLYPAVLLNSLLLGVLTDVIV